MKKVSIEQVEPQVARELETPLKSALKHLGYTIPESFRLRVSLLRADGRKKRSNAAADTWSPESDRKLWLEFGPSEVPSANPQQPETPSVSPATFEDAFQVAPGNAVHVHPAEADLLKALDRAESTPGWSFVSLKKFRDEVLPSQDIPSIRSDAERQNVLRSAIDKRLILKKPVPNPKSPQFPVTSIRLNRLMPEVQAVLGKPRAQLGFHPIHIKGEPLSATILRERR